MDELSFYMNSQSENELINQLIENLTQTHEKILYDETATKNLKYSTDELPNEFSSGYNIRFSEILIIIGILIFWLIAVRKFSKSFDKIRTTHYREIPYKYKTKDLENPTSLHSSQKETEAFKRDPLNDLVHESKFVYPYDIMSNNNTAASSVYSFNQHCVRENNDPMPRSQRRRLQFSILRNSTLNTCSFESKDAICKRKKNISNSLVNIRRPYSNRLKSHYRRDDSSLNDNIYRSKMQKVNTKRLNSISYTPRSSRSNEGQFKLNKSNSGTMNPMVRRSILDLHKYVMDQKSS